MDGTVIGGAIILDARVEALARRYDAHLPLTRDTIEQMRARVGKIHVGHVEARRVERVAAAEDQSSVEVQGPKARPEGEASPVVDCVGRMTG